MNILWTPDSPYVDAIREKSRPFVMLSALLA